MGVWYQTPDIVSLNPVSRTTSSRTIYRPRRLFLILFSDKKQTLFIGKTPQAIYSAFT